MKPIGLKLGIDFASLDKSLASVADRIEAVGREASQRLGSAAGSAASGDLDPKALSDAVSNVGVQLSQGIANGVRNSASLMLGFTGHIDQMLNRLAGAAITLFDRIDSSMKFPAFDSFFTTATLKVKNFTAIWKKPLSDLDLAIGGAFGGTMAAAARVLKVLIDQLSSSIAGALKSAIASAVAEVSKLGGGFARAEADASSLLLTVGKAAQPSRFNFGPGGIRSTVGGPRIGAGTQFTSGPSGTPAMGFGDPRRGAIPGGKEELIAVGRAALFAASVIPKVGAAFVSIPLGIITPLIRVQNFLGGLGKVGKKSFDDIYGSAKVALAPLSVGTKVAKAGLDGVAGSAKQVSSSVMGIGTAILGAFGFAGIIYQTVNFLKNGVKSASDLNEAVNASKTVFASSFGVVEKQAEQMNQQFRISKKEQFDIASGFGAIAQGAGFSEQASADLANRMTKLAANLSSSKNIPFAEAADKIRSAISGESEPLRKFGANVSDKAVNAYALANGLAKGKGELSDFAKISARAELIERGLFYAVGDLERTSGDAANQFRIAGGGIQEFGTRIGTLLLPVVKAGTVAFNEFLAIVLNGLDFLVPAIQSWAEYFSGAFDRVGVVVRNFGSFFQVAQLRVGEFVINAIAWIGTIPENWGPITAWLGRNWYNLLVDFGSMTMAAFTNLYTNATSFGKAFWAALKGEGFDFTWTPLLDGFKATTEQLPTLIRPDLISVDQQVNEILGKVSKKEEARKAAMAVAGEAAAAVKPEALDMTKAEKEKKVPEYKLAAAVGIDSKEAASTLARAASPGAQSRDFARRGVDIAKDSNNVLKSIDKKLDKGAPALKVV